MNKRDRSVANMRSEAQKIYHQRGTIKRLEKEINKYKSQQEEFIKCLEDEIDKIKEYQNSLFADGVKYGFQLSLSKYKDIIKERENNAKDKR